MVPKGIRFRVKKDLILLNCLRTQFEFEVNLGEISIVRTGIEKFASGQFPLFRQTLLLYLIFIFYLPRPTLPDFPSVPSLVSLPFCHRNKKSYCSGVLDEEFDTIYPCSQIRK